ncbi:hypothetical protein [Methanovulcanius yangii]|uniref:hypothetical protein n=1 Tax=Methanovulcanius yangii TaxID=1789227 RepID=UPI0029CA93FB|nr:hypothetical protein [Methanovulcanius yangii]
MLWSGWIVLLTTTEAYLWYAATTMNIISLSVVSIYNEVKRGRGRGPSFLCKSVNST